MVSIQLFVGQPLSPASFAFVNGARVVINNNTFNPPTFDGKITITIGIKFTVIL